jgi:DNA-binding MarR family transcriptional regulator
MAEPIKPAPAQYLRDDVIRGGMDLLLFAHKAHLRHADVELEKLGLGRAHHRCLYFVGRQPDLSVGDLLRLLSVTKQSLGRVLSMLLKQGLIEQRVGERDRRRRLLRLTPSGKALEHQLFEGMHRNMSQAYSISGEEAVSGYWMVMQNLMSEDVREQFANFHLR